MILPETLQGQVGQTMDFGRLMMTYYYHRRQGFVAGAGTVGQGAPGRDEVLAQLPVAMQQCTTQAAIDYAQNNGMLGTYLDEALNPIQPSDWVNDYTGTLNRVVQAVCAYATNAYQAHLRQGAAPSGGTTAPSGGTAVSKTTTTTTTTTTPSTTDWKKWALIVGAVVVGGGGALYYLKHSGHASRRRTVHHRRHAA